MGWWTAEADNRGLLVSAALVESSNLAKRWPAVAGEKRSPTEVSGVTLLPFSSSCRKADEMHPSGQLSYSFRPC